MDERVEEDHRIDQVGTMIQSIASLARLYGFSADVSYAAMRVAVEGIWFGLRGETGPNTADEIKRFLAEYEEIKKIGEEKS